MRFSHGKYLPIGLILFGVLISFLCMISLGGIPALVFLIIGLALVFNSTGIDINLQEKKYREYINFLGIEFGEYISFDTIEYVYVTPVRIKRVLISRYTSSETSNMACTAYIKFSETHYRPIMIAKSHEKVLKTITPVLNQHNIEIHDYVETTK